MARLGAEGASTSEMGRFETEFLTQEDKPEGAGTNKYPVGGTSYGPYLHRRVILDMTVPRVQCTASRREQPITATLNASAITLSFCSTSSGIVKQLSYGQALHSADDWQEVLDPVVERYLTAAVRLLFRADAAFAKPEIYDYLEARNIGYAIRLRSNQVLQRGDSAPANTAYGVAFPEAHRLLS